MTLPRQSGGPRGCNRPVIKNVRNFQRVAVGLFEAHSPDGKADCVETRTLVDDTQPNSGGRPGGVLTFPRVFAVLARGIVLALQISGGEWSHQEASMIRSTAVLLVMLSTTSTASSVSKATSVARSAP